MSERLSITKQGNSSLPLQIFIYFNWHFTVFFFLINMCLFTFKATYYYYPQNYLGLDLVLIFLYLIVDNLRLVFASRGNKTSQMLPLAISLVLGVPLIILHAYYISLQTYVLRVDVVTNAIALFLLSSELFLGVYTLVLFFYHSRRF